jgi:arylsulfatase A
MKIRVLIFYILLAAGLTVPAVGTAAEGRAYNFIVIMTDDLGSSDVGCYGSTEFETPNLDRLASEGMLFETCYATPICTSTRLMLMTGQYGYRNGYYNQGGAEYTPERKSPLYNVSDKFLFSDLLKTKGYATAVVGKWQMPVEHRQTQVRDCGFDEYRIWARPNNISEEDTERMKALGLKNSRHWQPSVIENDTLLSTKSEDFGPDMYTDFLIEFMEKNQDKPFFAYYPMALIHQPWVETPNPDTAGERLPEGLASNIRYCDHSVGRIIDAVDRLGLAENTFIIFTADNPTHGRGKGQTSEQGSRVPLLVRCKGVVPANTRTQELAGLVDVFPTLASFSGASVPEGHPLDGFDLAQVLTGSGPTERSWLYSFRNLGEVYRDKQYLYYTHKDTGDRPQFFDCGDRRDGEGYTNITGSKDPAHLAVRKKIKAALEAMPGPNSLPNMIQPSAELEEQKKARKKKDS